MNNRLFVVNKPIFRSSNSYLSRIKRKYKTKKAGFSGTLDPFAKGTLVVAFGQYTKLFQFLKKSPKVYKATLWLGADGESLDIERVDKIEKVREFSEREIFEVFNSLLGEFSYTPPKFSAKKVDGERAYNLARDGEEFELKKITSEIYSIELINYSHPFLSFQVSVSEGSYIRSIGKEIANRLGTVGILSYLHRVSEGEFFFDGEKSLNPLEYLDLLENSYLGDIEDLENGKKVKVENFAIQGDGKYLIKYGDFFSIIEIENGVVKYLLNRIEVGT
jgi:tRNA pseudouridine55 synthase